jgi:hypothetical protein
VNIQYPPKFQVEDLPDRQAVTLPNSGGRYITELTNGEGKLNISSSLLISKPVFSSEEYRYLKELFNIVVQFQNTSIVFKRLN